MVFIPKRSIGTTDGRGHVLQGRYKAILVDENTYLLELARYIVLNPVRAHLVQSAGKAAWSSYQAVMGKMPVPEWLAVDDILAMFHTQRGPPDEHTRGWSGTALVRPTRTRKYSTPGFLLARRSWRGFSNM